MDSAILQSLGLGGGVVSIIFAVIATLRKCLQSDCIKGKDGLYHLDIHLKTTQEQAAIIQSDEEMTKLFKQLNEMLQAKSNRSVSVTV